MAALESPILIRNGSYGLVELVPVVSVELLRVATSILDTWVGENGPLVKARENLQGIIRRMDQAGEFDPPQPGTGRWNALLDDVRNVVAKHNMTREQGLEYCDRQEGYRLGAVIGTKDFLSDRLSVSLSERDRGVLKQALTAMSTLPMGLGKIISGLGTPDAASAKTFLLPKVSAWVATPPSQRPEQLAQNAWRWPLNRTVWEAVFAPTREALTGSRVAKVISFLKCAAVIHSLGGSGHQDMIDRAASLQLICKEAPSNSQKPLSGDSYTLDQINRVGAGLGDCWNAADLISGSRFLTRLGKGEYTQHDDPEEDRPDPLRESQAFALFFSTGYLAANNKITPTLAAARLFASPQAAQRAKPRSNYLPDGPNRDVIPVVVEVLTQAVALAPNSPFPGAGQERIAQVMSAIDRDILRNVGADALGDVKGAGGAPGAEQQGAAAEAPRKRRAL